MSILLVGDVNADLTGDVALFPVEGDDRQIKRLQWGSGGTGLNSAVTLGVLGVSTRLLARVGTDPAAEIALAAARAVHTDLQLLQVDPHTATGLCVAIVTPNGERSFLSYRGANVNLQYTNNALHGCRWLHLSAYALLEGQQRQTTLQLIEQAHQADMPISLDLGLPTVRAHREMLLALLPQFSLLCGNQAEFQLLFGTPPEQAIQQALTAGVPLVALKCGAEGCVIATQTKELHVPGFAMEVVDSTGCGDAFVAGFLAAYQQHQPLLECARLGNACGALVVSRYGAVLSPEDGPRITDLLALPVDQLDVAPQSAPLEP